MILYNSQETNATNEKNEQDAEILIGKIRSYIPFYC